MSQLLTNYKEAKLPIFNIQSIVNEFTINLVTNQKQDLHLSVEEIITIYQSEDIEHWLLPVLESLRQAGKTTIVEVLGESILKKRVFKDELSTKNLYFILARVYQYQYQSKMDAAIDKYRKSLELSKDREDQSRILINMATTYRQAGLLKEAEQTLEKFFSSKDSNETELVYAEALIQKGLCFFANNLVQQAYDEYQKAYKIILTFDNHDLRLYNLLGISTTLEHLGKIDEAIETLKVVYNEAEKYGFQNYFADSMNGLSKKYIVLKEYDQAIYWAKEGLKLWEYSKFYRGQLVMCSHIIKASAMEGKSIEEIKPFLVKAEHLKSIVGEKLILNIYESSLECLRSLGYEY